MIIGASGRLFDALTPGDAWRDGNAVGSVKSSCLCAAMRSPWGGIAEEQRGRKEAGMHAAKSIYTKDLLRDFYEYLGDFSYVLGKVYPRYVDLRPYSAFDEDFLGPNYLAVGRDDTEVQRMLR